MSRFRVSDDVAARKHVGSAQTHAPVTPREGETAQRAAAPDSPQTGPPTPPTESIFPRQIRIDPSVKERRGLGGPRDSRGADG